MKAVKNLRILSFENFFTAFLSKKTVSELFMINKNIVIFLN